jgi:hypothetical protein
MYQITVAVLLDSFVTARAEKKNEEKVVIWSLNRTYMALTKHLPMLK